MAKLDYVFMVLKEHPYGRVTIKLFNPSILTEFSVSELT